MSFKVSNIDFFNKKTPKTPEEDLSRKDEKTLASETENASSTTAPKAKVVRIDPDMIKKGNDCANALRAVGMGNLATELVKCYQAASHDRFTIAVVGEFNRGKSTFLNHFFEKDILPTGILPTTAVMTRIVYNSRPAMLILDDRGKKIEERPLTNDSWKEFTIHEDSDIETQYSVVVGLDDLWLKQTCVDFLDTPGANDLGQKRARQIGDALMGCDAAIIAVSATAALSMTERLFIEERVMSRKLPFVMMIVTHLDQVAERERVNVIQFIYNRLKDWGLDIPIYFPYKVNISDSSYDTCMGMDKIRAQIEDWIAHPERMNATKLWLSGKTSDLMKSGISALTEQKLLMEASSNEQREKLLTVKRMQLKEAQLIWEKLHKDMEHRCSDCYDLLVSKVDEFADTITERLQYEAGHAPVPKRWWEEDFPYRIKVELINLANSVQAVVSRRINEDARWYGLEIERSFRCNVLYHSETIADKDLLSGFSATDIQFEDLDKKRGLVRIGTTVLTIASALVLQTVGGMPTMVATMGVGTTAGLFTDRLLRSKIEQQRNEIKKELEKSIPQFIRNSLSESEDRVEAVYHSIISEGEATESRWLEQQMRAIEANTVASKSDSYEKVCNNLALLQQVYETL